jgi:hypothetical protein
VAFRSRRKSESELIELVRTEFAAFRSEVQANMTETAAVLSVRVRSEVEHRMGEPSALAAGIQGVRETVATRDSELVQALGALRTTCDALTERVQIDRVERTALVDAISRLTTAVAVTSGYAIEAAPASLRPTVLGGTVDPAQPADAPGIFGAATDTEAVTFTDEIDLEAAAREPEEIPPPAPGRPVRPDDIEVRCRFGDRWVTGFEVCEVIRLNGATRYRLRRRSDGSVIPTLFDEKDLRFFSTAFIDPT